MKKSLVIFLIAVIAVTSLASADLTNFGRTTGDEIGSPANTIYQIFSGNTNPFIFFEPSPETPSNNSLIGKGHFKTNTTIDESSLEKVIYNFNETNYTLYNDSLVGMWNFDYYTKFNDTSRYENDGSCSGTSCPTFNSSGKYNGAYEFDGNDDYIETKENFIDKGDNQTTISAWLKPREKTSTKIIVSHHKQNDFGYEPFLGSSGNIWIRTSPDGSTWHDTDTGVSYEINEWTYFTMKVNSTSRHLYLNGEEEWSDSKGGINFPDQKELAIGVRGYQNSYDYNFNGTIDEVRIWNRSLSEDEVKQHYMSNLRKFNETLWKLEVNQTKNSAANLETGSYIYQSLAEGSAGYRNSTEKRTINIDLTPPFLKFKDPTPSDDKTQTDKNATINISSNDIENETLKNDSLQHSTFLNWNNSLVGWWEMDWSNETGIYDSSTNLSSSVIGEAGTFEVSDGNWKTINFKSSYKEPVVVGTTNTKNDGEHALVFESKDVTSTSAKMRLCESEGGSSSGCDTHPTETAGFLVIDAADTDSIEGIEAGKFDIDSGIDSNLNTVNYDGSYSNTPIVAANVMTSNGKSPVEGRVTDTSTTDFTSGICYQDSQDGCDSGHTTETLGWIAIEPGNQPFGEAGSTGNSVSGSQWVSQPFTKSFSSTPVGIVSTQTEDGAQELQIDEAKNIDTSGMDVRYCELEGPDDCDSHTSENVGWFAITSGTITDSGATTQNNNFGTFNGGLSEANKTEGKRGKGLEFDGSDDYVEIGDKDNLDIKDDITMSAWVYSDGQGDNEIISKREEYLMSIENQELYIRTWGDNNGGAGSVPQNKWTHVAIYWNNEDSAKVYINGSLEQTASVVDSNTGTSNPLVIGKRSGSNSDYFDGSIDSVQIYDRALNESEIKALYNASKNQYHRKFNDLETGTYKYTGYSIDKFANVNSTEQRTLTIKNATPTINASFPPNDHTTTNRTPKFNWTASDPEGDTLTYELNITCSPGCSADDRLISGITQKEYVVTNYLGYLSDNGFSYNWSVRATDGNSYSNWTEERTLNVQSLIQAELPQNTTDFGSLGTGESKNTTNNNPQPLRIENTGNALINSSLNSTQLWQSVSHPSNNYQYQITENESSSYNPPGSQTTWANVPSITTHAINDLNWTQQQDSADIELYASVPSQEPAGDKQSTITITSSLSEEE